MTTKYKTKNKFTFEFVQLDRKLFIEHRIMERPTTVLLDAEFNIKKIIIKEIPQKNGKDFVQFLKENM